jgi:hypothetical protein
MLPIDGLNVKVFDCFTYFNEVDLLRYRIAHCYDYVDYFVIIEADKTHTGMAKPTKLDLKLIDSRFHDKIIYEHVSFPRELGGDCTEAAWKREHYQREQIKPHLERLANEHDLCIVSDLDEICNYKLLFRYLEEKKLFSKFTHHINITFVFNVHYHQSRYWHCASFSCPYGYIRSRKLSDLRFAREKVIDGEAPRARPCFEEQPKDLYTRDGEFCFYHYNRFLDPSALSWKNMAIAEGLPNIADIDLNMIRCWLERIVKGNWGGLTESNYKIDDKLCNYVNQIHTNKIEDLNRLWLEVKDLDDPEFIDWYNNYFGPIGL